MPNTPTLTASLLILLSSYGAAHAGAWSQPEGGGYYEASGRVLRASEIYGADGSIVDIPTLTEYSLGFVGEYGATDRFTVLVSMPFFQRVTSNRQVSASSGFVLDNGDANTWIGDGDIGVRAQILTFGRAVISAEAHVGLPFGDSTNASGLLTGDGEVNVFGALLFGYRFGALPIETTASAGFNKRTEGFSDELRYVAAGSWELYDNLFLRVSLSGMISLEDGNRTLDANGVPLVGGNKGLFANDQSLLLLSPSLAWEFVPGLGVEVGADATLIGRNVPAAPAFSLAMFAKI